MFMEALLKNQYKLEINAISFNRWMDKETVVYPYYGSMQQ